MKEATADSVDLNRRQTPKPTRGTSIKDRKCLTCPRLIPAGEPHVYDGDSRRWHAECYRP